MKPALLREIGTSLYGPLWLSEMARKLGRSRKTIQRYAEGKRTPPPDFVAALAEDVAERRSSLGELLRKMK